MAADRLALATLYSMEKQPHHRGGHYDPDPDVEWACLLCPKDGATGSRALARRDAERHLTDHHNVVPLDGEATS